MARRSNHYDAAFEEFLRRAAIPHVVVDETRRALLRQASLKSMDFIVSSQQEHNLLVDIKGRRFPSGRDGRSHKWENWASTEDVQSLLQWQQVFGNSFRAVLVFAYHLIDQLYVAQTERPMQFKNRWYAFYGVWVDEYEAHMQPRSASWQTVSLPGKDYRRLRAPIHAFL